MLILGSLLDIHAHTRTRACKMHTHIHTHTQGLVLVSVFPAVGILAYMRHLYRKSVLPIEMAYSLFLSMAAMSIFVTVESRWGYLLVGETGVADRAADPDDPDVNGSRGYFVLLCFIEVRT